VPAVASLPQAAAKHGKTTLIVQYVLLLWWSTMRTEHSWVSTFYPSLDTALYITRPQRLATLCCAILANMAVSALFFGTEPTNVVQTTIASFASTAVMFPIMTVVPMLFQYSNTYFSSWKRNIVKARQAKRRAKLLASVGVVCVAVELGCSGVAPRPSGVLSLRTGTHAHTHTHTLHTHTDTHR
jgi:hypothetical protein